MADPNKPMFDNLYNATYVQRPFGSLGNNNFTQPGLEAKLPLWPTLPQPEISGPAPVQFNPLSPLPYGQQIMRQIGH